MTTLLSSVVSWSLFVDCWQRGAKTLAIIMSVAAMYSTSSNNFLHNGSPARRLGISSILTGFQWRFFPMVVDSYPSQSHEIQFFPTVDQQMIKRQGKCYILFVCYFFFHLSLFLLKEKDTIMGGWSTIPPFREGVPEHPPSPVHA